MPDSVVQDVFTKDVKTTGDLPALRALPIGVIVFDRELKVQSANPYSQNFVSIQTTADSTLAIGTNENIWGSWQAILKTVLNTGKTRRFDNVSYQFNGNSALLQITCSAIKDNDSILGGIIMLENVTEKATLQKQYAHNERLAALGKLASKVAHELNNPMDGVLRYINLAKRTISQQGLVKPVEYLDNADNGLKRMIGIITELLEFSRNKQSPLEDTSTDKILEEAIKYNEPMANAAAVKIERKYIVPLPKARVGNLFQVFCNLLKNAIEAMPDGGNIIITCDVSDDNIAAFKFRDTGKGIDPKLGQAIFEPFFSTKTGRKGTGLGLAICKDIIEKHGGKITAENAPPPDTGSIFTVYLPVNK
jgi:signal transduction histidine kinase